MKKLFFLLIAVVAMASMTSCDSDEIQNEIQSDSSLVKVELTPSFSSGNITRATDLYSQMHHKISGLLSDSYSLTFTETTTGKKYTFSGNWGDSILIKSGTYRVVGTNKAPGDVIQEKCSLKFDTEVNIKPTDTNVILSAQFDCFLLLFDKKNITSVVIYYGINDSKIEKKTLFEVDNIIYGFSRGIYNKNSNLTQFISINYSDQSQESIYTKDKIFEIGKYYTWEGNSYVRNCVSIPIMTQGNI